MSDNILFAQELVGHIHSRMGFGEIWLDMIWLLISNCQFLVLVNGDSYGFFPSTRGCRQGDPLSPSLFIIAFEVFSIMLNNMLSLLDFRPYSVPSSCEPITHLAYVDDVLIFFGMDKRSLKCLKHVIKKFEEISGQLINLSKSYFLTSPKASPQISQMVKDITGFSWK